MRKILLTTTLLSIAMSENILMENYLRPKTMWIRDKQFENTEIKRAPLNEMSSEVEELLNYDDDRQLPRISKTRFSSDSRNLPTLTFMRSLPVGLLSSNKPKLGSAKPTVLISIDIQDPKNMNDNSQKGCTRVKNHKQNHAWQVQQPFYVEEPRWINIYPIDDSPHHLTNTDPYILSRGKKIFRIENSEQAEKTIENYEDLSKYPSENKRLTKNRVRRSVAINEKSQNHITNDNQNDKKKETNYYNFLQYADSNNITMTESQDEKSYKIDQMPENEKNEKNITSSVPNIFIKKYQKDKMKNMTENSPYELKFIKRNRILSNHMKNDNGKIAKISQDKNFINQRNKRSVLKNKNFSKVDKKCKTQKIDTSFEKNIEKNETDVYEQMKNKALYIDKLDDLNKYNNDTFILSSKRMESLNKKDTDHNKSIERPWKIQYYTYDRNLESEEEPTNEKNELEIDKNDTKATSDSQLANRMKNYFSHRKKRNVCDVCNDESEAQWLRDMEKKLQDSLALERRNKHSDILEGLSLQEPYVISRGKKASHEIESSIYSELESRNVNDVDRIKGTKALLRMLLMEMSKCDNCKMNADKRSPKDRRSLLDEILTTYDPYYIVRGKRINLDSSEMKSPQNEKNLIRNRWKTIGLNRHVIREYDF